jgi:hypothetical protein
MFHFNNGYNCQYSYGGQGGYLGSKTAYYDFSLGWIIRKERCPPSLTNGYFCGIKKLNNFIHHWKGNTGGQTS